MKPEKNILLISLLLMMSCRVFSQKETFDVVSFKVPADWKQQQSEGGIQLSVSENKTGAYAIVVITKATASARSANENFTADWIRLVKGAVQVNGEPAMQAPANGNGWDIISGTANYTDGANKGLATLLSATGGGQTVSAVLMTNSNKYEKELLNFLNSLELSKVSQSGIDSIGTKTANTSGASSIVGLWVRYINETSGYINGMPQLTAGYFRREYFFYGDGTYMFRAKDWSVFMKNILFVCEKGRWSVNGNQLTLTPTQGIGEWWSKAASGKTTEWGSKLKASDYKLEPVTYTFDLHYFSGMQETDLLLENKKATERDGGSSGNGETNKWSYSPRASDKSLIDNPPGFKTGNENKSISAGATKEGVGVSKAVLARALLQERYLKPPVLRNPGQAIRNLIPADIGFGNTGSMQMALTGLCMSPYRILLI